MRINKIHTSKNLSYQIKNNKNSVRILNCSAMPNFQSSYGQLTQLEKSFLKQDELNIPNLLDINNDIHIPRSKMPKEHAKYNSAGVNVVVEDDINSKTYRISNDKGDMIALARFDKKAKELPKVTYRQGKFMPELTIADSSLENKKIKMFAGSEIKGKNFEIKMFGQYEPSPNSGYKQINFSGNNIFLTKNKENTVVSSVNSYYQADCADEITRGDYSSFVEERQPEVICFATAKDDRLVNITGKNNSNYSTKLPTNQKFSSLGLTLNSLVMAGLLSGDEDEDKITYLNSKTSDASAIAQGILDNKIDINKDVIFTSADLVTNADLSRAYHTFANLPSAAIAIPYYTLNSQKAQGVDLLGVTTDEKDNKQITDIIQNAQYTFEAPDPNDYINIDDYDNAMSQYDRAQAALIEEDSDEFIANSGIYFFSKDAMKVLFAHGLVNGEEVCNLNDVVGKVLELSKEGKLNDKDGKPLKIYAIPLEQKGGKEAFIGDINTAESYLKFIKDVGQEYRKHGLGKGNKYYGFPEFMMKDFSLNANSNTGIVYDSYDSKMAFDSFKSKYQLNQYHGNIYIVGE